MIRILDWYIARTLLGTVTVTLSVLIGLSALIKFVEQLKKVGEGNYDMVAALVYVLLSLPRDLEQFFPMAVLLGGLIGMGLLASNSELVVMQAAGLSRWNLIASAMKSAVVMIIIVMAVGEWVTPVSESRAKELRTEAITGGSLFSSDKYVWAKDGDHFVSIGQVASRDSLQEVTIYRFSDSLQLDSITNANGGFYEQDSWTLTQVTHTYFGEDAITAETLPTWRWDSSLTPDKLGIVTIKPEALSIQGLVDYITYRANNKQDTSRYELAFWRKVLQPVTVCVMLLMALSFIFGPLRSVTMGARIIMGVLTGFGFFITNEVFGPLSLVYNIPPAMGALLPSILFAAVATALLSR
ncbi:LPS export ABC transporter permease LptG [Alteromonas lipolytica]|uniref:Lipopolysaccharide ABC transporter permease LptG n=1 Tax=Alteromonas lipolytica TaxID=1856405 RepID=A0A1E8FA45_9ALTE|nr:LPS export ABC transporter permease LptG [Alteromonas lipolytica]OFI32787.1 lipopolysaccharide ABC transporter permease LptG [Alteromonas lipolytica]GGF73004.1 LPS export ABC transporter permease LptG [Alteromonas lipolytica]